VLDEAIVWKAKLFYDVLNGKGASGC